MALDYSHTETLRTGASSTHAAKAIVPQLDLCVMNPPFVRSVGGNLLFGSLPDERGKLQAELKRRVKKIGASTTAGLGSVFVALADRWLNVGGRLAFVLPAALVSGEAWSSTRALIANRYHLETVVASHDAELPNFSENTDLSEILFIARKRASNKTAGRTTYINLWRNPRSIHEALDLANRLIDAPTPVTIEGQGITTVRGTSGKLGEIISLPPAQRESNWTGALFAQSELLRVCWMLEQGQLRIVGNNNAMPLPMCRLDALGSLGYDRRDIHDAFEVSTYDWSPYVGFWGHEADKVKTMSQQPNVSLLARTEAAKGRKLKSATDVWAKAGRILVVERLWPITHKVLAVGLHIEALGNTWWSFKSQSLNEDQEKALLFWLNSSFALLLYFGRRVITRSAWMQMKKPAWASMPVLDVHALSAKQIADLAGRYDWLSGLNLRPLGQLKSDDVRAQIDSAITSTLGLPNVDFIRELLEREPELNANDISPRDVVPTLKIDEDEDQLTLV